MNTHTHDYIKALILAFFIAISVSGASAWTGPSAPPPNGNVSSPINTSNRPQVKDSRLTVAGFRSIGSNAYMSPAPRPNWPVLYSAALSVNGSTGASEYCDDNALNCKTVVQLAQNGQQGPQGLPGEADVPSGAVVPYNASSCPSGWTRFSAANGRYVVGLTTGGNLGDVIGDDLSDGENRPTGEHKHTYTYWKSLNAYTTDNKSKVALNQMGLAPNPKTANNNTHSGTNAPYVQLLYCEKN